MSRKLVLYIAMSLDGYIADEHGGVSWLDSATEPVGDGGYAAFLERIDTVILGRRTYDQIVTELSPGGMGVPRSAKHCADPPPVCGYGRDYFYLRGGRRPLQSG